MTKTVYKINQQFDILKEKRAYKMHRSFDVFNKRRATLVVLDLVLVVSLDVVLLRLAKAAASAAVHGDVIVGQHRGNPSRIPRRKNRVKKSAGISGSVTDSQKRPKCTAIRSERSRASHLIHLIKSY